MESPALERPEEDLAPAAAEPLGAEPTTEEAARRASTASARAASRTSAASRASRLTDPALLSALDDACNAAAVGLQHMEPRDLLVGEGSGSDDDDDAPAAMCIE